MSLYLVYSASAGGKTFITLSQSGGFHIPEVFYALVEDLAEAELIAERLKQLEVERIKILELSLFTHGSGRGHYTDELARLMKKPEFFGKTEKEKEFETKWARKMEYWKDPEGDPTK